MNSGGASRGRIVGLDIGTRRIGVARSDELGIIASPEATILVERTPAGEASAIDAIVAFVREAGARRVVAGLPRNMKGERGVQAEWTEGFVARLRAALDPLHVRVSLYDERLTSVMAERVEREEGGKAARRGSDPRGRRSLDARAAAILLQGYLDRRRLRDARDLDDGTAG